MESGNETKLTLNLEQLACNDWDLGLTLILLQPENWDLVQPWMTGTGTHHNAFRRLYSTHEFIDGRIHSNATY